METLIYILKIKIDSFVVEIRLKELKYFSTSAMTFRVCFSFLPGATDSNHSGTGWVV